MSPVSIAVVSVVVIVVLMIAIKIVVGKILRNKDKETTLDCAAND